MGALKTHKYKDVRTQINSGDILLCSGNSYMSKKIRQVTESKWSHVGFLVWINSPEKHLMVMESVESLGVRMMPFSNYLDNYNGDGKKYDGEIAIARHEDFKEEYTNRLSSFAYKLVGNHYNLGQLGRIAGRIAIKKPRDPLKYDNEFICSEYVQHCFRSVGIEIPANEGGFISPADYDIGVKIRKLFFVSN